MFVNIISLIVKRDSMNDNPVSDAPTTTIRELLDTLWALNYFFVNIANEKGGAY